MKKGDIIQCHDQKDLRKTMEDLSAAGFHAVKDSGNNFDIRITGVPETQYMVEARSEVGGVLRTFCDTLEEAGEIAAGYYGSSFQWVEILRGYPGEWESVAQSW
jgi:hypothetical protein